MFFNLNNNQYNDHPLDINGQPIIQEKVQEDILINLQYDESLYIQNYILPLSEYNENKIIEINQYNDGFEPLKNPIKIKEILVNELHFKGDFYYANTIIFKINSIYFMNELKQLDLLQNFVRLRTITLNFNKYLFQDMSVQKRSFKQFLEQFQNFNNNLTESIQIQALQRNKKNMQVQLEIAEKQQKKMYKNIKNIFENISQFKIQPQINNNNINNQQQENNNNNQNNGNGLFNFNFPFNIRQRIDDYNNALKNQQKKSDEIRLNNQIQGFNYMKIIIFGFIIQSDLKNQSLIIEKQIGLEEECYHFDLLGAFLSKFTQIQNYLFQFTNFTLLQDKQLHQLLENLQIDLKNKMNLQINFILNGCLQITDQGISSVENFVDKISKLKQLSSKDFNNKFKISIDHETQYITQKQIGQLVNKLYQFSQFDINFHYLIISVRKNHFELKFQDQKSLFKQIQISQNESQKLLLEKQRIQLSLLNQITSFLETQIKEKKINNISLQLSYVVEDDIQHLQHLFDILFATEQQQENLQSVQISLPYLAIKQKETMEKIKLFLQNHENLQKLKLTIDCGIYHAIFHKNHEVILNDQDFIKEFCFKPWYNYPKPQGVIQTKFSEEWEQLQKYYQQNLGLDIYILGGSSKKMPYLNNILLLIPDLNLNENTYKINGKKMNEETETNQNNRENYLRCYSDLNTQIDDLQIWSLIDSMEKLKNFLIFDYNSEQDYLLFSVLARQYFIRRNQVDNLNFSLLKDKILDMISYFDSQKPIKNYAVHLYQDKDQGEFLHTLYTYTKYKQINSLFIGFKTNDFKEEVFLNLNLLLYRHYNIKKINFSCPISFLQNINEMRVLYNINLTRAQKQISQMNFCPLCGNCLLIESSAKGYQFQCKTCDYVFPLTQKKQVIQKPRIQKDYTIFDLSMQKESLQTDKDAQCPSCEKRGAYVRLEQDRSLDEGQTHHYTCQNCSHTWKELG
ncbi:hypothetical protein PPERSA_11368 [Pseudocohnilembus persalinus]|uniref:TFIIS-type domain-containing protein n=1 Tax=Pseudocohnilembus persalinus TaxID=266149 RepID=A0A0V0QPW9_PSEPJ|nr:hypothetical protein PPERSA_11368 [Pseudocohnilembus persalinus]|eukprot:KRX04244.1 hypothetical protein PPERSA_11368 [Pseudocohnilembus persalinus]